MVGPTKALVGLGLAALLLSGCSARAGESEELGRRLHTYPERTARENSLATLIKHGLDRGRIHNAHLVPRRTIVAEGYRACGWLSQQPLVERVDREWMLTNERTMQRYFDENAASGDWRVEPSINGARRRLVQAAWDDLCADTRVDHIFEPSPQEESD